MLDELFMQVLDLSITGSIVILAVIAARFCLKKAPKIVSYALWAVVLVRLLCPMSLELPVSVMPEITPVKDTYALADIPVSVLDAGTAVSQAVQQAVDHGTEVEYIPIAKPITEGKTEAEFVAADWRDLGILFGQYVWLAGLSLMLLHSLVAYIRLRKHMKVRIPLEKGVFLCDDIDSPFVVGVLKPCIYLPSGLGERERGYILAHERHHIRRMDPLWKLLAYGALVLHWFNPLVWVAFAMACKDMEMSCDEAVIQQLGSEVRAEYAASLVTLATGKRIIAGTPLAFGEGDPKGRIHNLSKWKRPTLWVIVTAICLSLVLSACLLIDPAQLDVPDISTAPTEQTESTQLQSTVPAATTQPDTSVPDPTQPTSGQSPVIRVTDTPFVTHLSFSNQKFNGSAPHSQHDNVLMVVNPNSGQVLLIYTPDLFYIPNPAKNGEKDLLFRCGAGNLENAGMALSQLYDVPISYYVHTGLKGIMNVVDMLGGITVQAQTDSHIGTMEIPAGDNKLSGRQVLDAREHCYDSKFTIQVLGALLRKANGGNLTQLAEHLKDQIYTNMTVQEAISLQKLKNSNGAKCWNITSYTVSGEESYLQTGENEIYICTPDMATVEYAKELIQQVLAGKMLTPVSVMYEIPNTDIIRIVKQLDLPAELAGAKLVFNDREIVSVTNATMLRRIHTLFSKAEWLGYEPKTYSLGPELIMTGVDGTVWKAQICLEQDLLYVDGEFYDYGPGYNEEGARNAILHMLSLFDLHDWPHWMYEWYEDIGWNLAPPELLARYP